MNVFVFPYHAQKGILNNTIDVFFGFLSDNLTLHLADAHICGALDHNGLLHKSRVYNVQGKSVNTLTIFGTVATFSILGPISLLFVKDCVLHNFFSSLIETFHSLVANIAWWPRPDLDGHRAAFYRSKFG